MDQVQEANEAIYRRLLEACGRCKLDVQAKQLFKKMKSQNIQPDAYTHSAYIQAMSLDLVQAPVVESKRASLTPVKSQVFDMHTSLDLENIVFLSSDICPACCSLQTEEEIMSSFPKSFVTYTTKCSKCAGQYVPRFLVIQDVNEILEAEFLSPVVMYREIEHCLQSQKNEKFLITTSFRMNYRTLFWNLVLYFKLIKLPTFFLNPKLHMDEQLLQKTLEEITGVSKQSKTIQQLQLTPQPQVKEPSLESSFGFSEEEQNMDQSEQDQKTFFERKFNFLKGITNSKSESVSSEKSNNKSNSSQSEVSPKRKQIKKHMPISMRELRRVFGKEIQQFRFWNKVKCEIYNLEDLRAPVVQ